MDFQPVIPAVTPLHVMLPLTCTDTVNNPAPVKLMDAGIVATDLDANAANAEDAVNAKIQTTATKTNLRILFLLFGFIGSSYLMFLNS